MLDDARVRQQALNITGSYIVQAPAGSGKTGLLTQRFLALLGVVREPEECLAITFTKKAQAEMQNRILGELIAAKNATPVTTEYERTSRELANKVLAQDAKYGWELLVNPKRLKVKTIDSLCASITGKMPVTSLFGGKLQITNEVQACFTLAADRVLTDDKIVEPYRQALNTLLEHLDNNKQLVKRLFLSMLPVREQWLPYLLETQALLQVQTQSQHKQQDEKNLEYARKVLSSGWRQLAKDTLSDLTNSVPEEIASLVYPARQAGIYLRSLARGNDDSVITKLADYDFLPTVELKDLPAWFAWAELLLTKDCSWRKTLTVRQGFPAASSFKAKEEKEFYQQNKQQMLAGLELLREPGIHREKFKEDLALLKCLPTLEYDDKQWEVIQALALLLPYLVAQLILVFKEKDQVDFSEVSTAARVALGGKDEPSALALALDYKLNHILVDEFQDTSIAQFKLLEQLTAGWEQNDGRTLFLVGDPMQSIYRFRQAEVGLFLQVSNEGLGDISLTPLKLTTNFRADGNLVQWQNRVFAEVFPAENNPVLGAISFSPAVPVKSSDTSRIEFFVTDEIAETTEALAIVDLVNELKHQAPKQTIAVLVRARRHLVQLITGLKANNIPYQGVEIESLIDSYVVKDLLALTNAILHLGDRIAWLAVLRAPWCGLTLADLDNLFAKEHDKSIWQQLQEFLQTEFAGSNLLPIESKKRLQFIVPVLQLALAEKDRKPLSSLIQTSWELLAGPQCLEYKYHKEDAVVFFNLLQQYEDSRDIYQQGFFADKLQNLFSKPKNIDPYAVQLMTIHKAKGLEFDHVILPGLGKKPKGQTEKLLAWEQRVSVEGGAYLLLAPIKEFGVKEDPTYKFLKYTAQKKDKNELIRLFYVAATRAKLGLYGFGHLVKDKPQENSMLALLWDKVEFEKLESPQAAGEEADSNDVTPFNSPSLKRIALADLQKNYLTNQTKVSDLENLFKQSAQEVAGLADKIPSDNGVVRLDNTENSASKTLAENELFRQVGILVHQVFCQIAATSSFSWNESLIQQWRQLMVGAGVVEENLTPALNLVTQAVQTALKDPVGKWILDNNHLEAKVEWELMANRNGKIKKYIIDRSFVDENNCRWVIDYKVCQQVEIKNILPKYIQQLQNYKDIVADLKPNEEIKLGLYFPLQAYWQEIN